MKIPPETYDEVQDCLFSLAKETASPLVLLTDLNGEILSSYGREKMVQSSSLPILVCSSFAASLEVFNHDGRQSSEPSYLLLEGEEMGIYITFVREPLLLSILFPPTTTIGQLQISTRKARAALKDIRLSTAQKVAPQELISRIEEVPGFETGAQRQIEALFRRNRIGKMSKRQ